MTRDDRISGGRQQDQAEGKEDNTAAKHDNDGSDKGAVEDATADLAPRKLHHDHRYDQAVEHERRRDRRDGHD